MTAMVQEVAGMALTAERFVEVKADKGLAARFSAWVLVGAILCLMVRARSILSSRLLSKGQYRPKGVTVFRVRGPGVRRSSGKRAWALWLLKTRIASLTEVNMVSWMADI